MSRDDKGVRTAWLPTLAGGQMRRLAYVGARYGPEPWLRYSPTFIGLLFAVGSARARGQVLKNLRRIYGKRTSFAEVIDLSATFVRYAHCLAESLAVERTAAQQAQCQCRGEQHLREALAQGRGAVVVTLHTGAWDLAARFLRQLEGVEVLLVMDREADAKAQAYHDRARARSLVQVAHVSHPLDGLRLLRHLGAGGVVAIQLDRVASQSRLLDTKLFGEPFQVPEGPFVLAGAARSPLLLVTSRRLGYFRYEVVVGPPQHLPRRPGREDISRAVGQLTPELERFLRANATDWFHFRDG